MIGTIQRNISEVILFVKFLLRAAFCYELNEWSQETSKNKREKKIVLNSRRSKSRLACFACRIFLEYFVSAVQGQSL